MSKSVVIVNSSQPKVTRDEETSTEELLRLDWSIAMSMKH